MTANTSASAQWMAYMNALQQNMAASGIDPNSQIGMEIQQQAAPSLMQQATGILAKEGIKTGIKSGLGIGGSAGVGAAGGGAAGAGSASAGVAAPSMVVPQAGYAIPGGTSVGAGGTTAGATTTGFLPYAGGALALGAYLSNLYEGGVKDAIKGKADRRDWTNIALDINPVTAPINMGLRLLGMPSVGNRLASGKSAAQQVRDDIRGVLVNSGIADDKFLANGFDIGKDGGARLTNLGTNIDGKTERQYFDVDFSNPLAKDNVSKVIPVVQKLLGANIDEKRQSDAVGMLINALTHNAKTQSDFDTNFSNLFSKVPGLSDSITKVIAAPPRSQTVSPGIKKDGTRIDYSKKK